LKLKTFGLALASPNHQYHQKIYKGSKFCGGKKMKLWGQPTKGRSKEPSQPSQKDGPTANISDSCDTCDASTHTEDKKDSKKATKASPDLEQILGMTIEQALVIWDKQGRPVIYLGPGENCLKLAKLLEQREIKLEHLSAIKEWLEKHLEDNHAE